MKHCPRCKMTVREDDECPFCHTSLLYEPQVYGEKEHILHNRYYWAWLFKNVWFAAACEVYCLIVLLLCREPFIAELALAGLLPLLASIFSRLDLRLLRFFYAETWAQMRRVVWQYVLPALIAFFVSVAYFFVFN